MKKIVHFLFNLPLAAGLLFSCQQPGPEYDELSLETNSIIITTGQKDTVMTAGGSGEIGAVTDKQEVASVSVAAVSDGSPAVVVEGVSAGSAVVTVTDLQTGENLFLSVTVHDGLLLSSYEEALQEGHTVSIDILSGNGDYTATVENAEVVSAVVEGSVLNISALSEGESEVVLKDEVSGQEAVVAVTVEAVPVVRFTSTYRFGNLRITMNAPEEFRDEVWIDLNANSVQDEGEKVETFGTLAQYPFDPAVNPDVAIYGRVTDLSMTIQFITDIDITGNHYLERLNLMGNRLSAEGLDLSASSSLHYLNLSSIPDLAQIDLSGLPLLDTLDVSGTALTSLDVSGNPELISLSCISTSVTSIEFGSISKVQRLNIWNNEIAEIDLSGLPLLNFLNLYGNPLTSLDVSNNPELTMLSIGGTETLGSLDLSANGNITEFYAYDMGMTDASFLQTMPAPEKVLTIQINGNKFTDIDLSGFTEVNRLQICSNQLTSGTFDAIIEALPQHEESDAASIYVIDSGPTAFADEGNDFTAAHLSALIAKGWWVYDLNSGGDAIRLKEGDLD